jgi:hypothetical protein
VASEDPRQEPLSRADGSTEHRAGEREDEKEAKDLGDVAFQRPGGGLWIDNTTSYDAKRRMLELFVDEVMPAFQPAFA